MCDQTSGSVSLHPQLYFITTGTGHPNIPNIPNCSTHGKYAMAKCADKYKYMCILFCLMKTMSLQSLVDKLETNKCM
jgi:hypothetical protein